MTVIRRRFKFLVFSITCMVLMGTDFPEFASCAENGAVDSQSSTETASKVEPDPAEKIDPKLMKEVIRLIAEFFRVPQSEIHPDMDLKRDLLADEMDVYELVVQIFEAKGKKLKPGLNFTTVKSVAFQVQKASYKPKRFNLILRGKEDGKPKNLKNTRIQKIFYATNREKTGKALPADIFSGQRSSNEQKLTYGICEVAIPKKHARGNLELPSSWALVFNENPNPKKHFVLKKVDFMDWASFINTMNESLDSETNLERKGRDILVFIHGFNVPFKKAAMRTAQIAFDLRFQGTPVLFSWPSDGNILSYMSDREDVEWSINHLEQFISRLNKESKANRLHLVAHSMGNQGLIGALHQMAMKKGRRGKPLFENVILAAPDFDAQRFIEQIAPQTTHLAKRWTIYASDKDMALNASSRLSVKRLGTPLELVEGIDTIDATGVEVTPWSVPEFHSYYASKSRVISDLKKVLLGQSPEKRNLVVKIKRKLRYWKLNALK